MLLQVSTTMFVAGDRSPLRGIDLTVGSTMALVSVIVALLINRDRGRHPGRLSGAPLIGLLNGFHLTSET